MHALAYRIQNNATTISILLRTKRRKAEQDLYYLQSAGQRAMWLP
jgi:two-component sensor histidine kinase